MSLLVNSQRKGSPTWIFIWKILLPWVGWTFHYHGSKACVTSQEDASGFPPGDSTPSCLPQDGLDPSSMRPQPVRIRRPHVKPQIKLQLVKEKTRQTHDLQHRPLHPAEVDPPRRTHLCLKFSLEKFKFKTHLDTFTPRPLHQLADWQRNLFEVDSENVHFTSRVQTRP